MQWSIMCLLVGCRWGTPVVLFQTHASKTSYEVQLESEIQGYGLGSYLIDIMEALGRRMHLYKSYLTVFKSNERAMTFYSKRGCVQVVRCCGLKAMISDLVHTIGTRLITSRPQSHYQREEPTDSVTRWCQKCCDVHALDPSGAGTAPFSHPCSGKGAPRCLFFVWSRVRHHRRL